LAVPRLELSLMGVLSTETKVILIQWSIKTKILFTCYGINENFIFIKKVKIST